MSDQTEQPDPEPDYPALAQSIKHWGMELGFQQVGITDTELAEDEAHLLQWLKAGNHGEMDYMERHGTRRSRPGDLVPGTIRVISVRMNYWPADAQDADAILQDPALAYLSRYALGRDYHKMLRKRLQKLADRIAAQTGPFGYRVFTGT
jgi:epoxyqueuosine reductase